MNEAVVVVMVLQAESREDGSPSFLGLKMEYRLIDAVMTALKLQLSLPINFVIDLSL